MNSKYNVVYSALQVSRAKKTWIIFIASSDIEFNKSLQHFAIFNFLNV